jgi:hypothetical protein
MTTEIKERPILFSGAMVRAILRGDKTQTRRVVKPQLEHGCIACPYCKSGWGEATSPNEYGGSGCLCTSGENVHCPPGEFGDRLWVRERWATDLHNEQDSPSRIAQLAREAGYVVDAKHPAGPIWYAADESVRRWGDFHDVRGKWRPSIHMPRWASRITLEVTNVRCERLREISEVDAQAEGVAWPNPDTDVINGKRHPTCIDAFAKLWDDINANRGFPWDSNPWIWAVEFKTTECIN